MEEVALVNIDDDRRMSEPEVSTAEYLLSGPKVDDLDIERDRSFPREVDLVADDLDPLAARGITEGDRGPSTGG